MDQIYALIKKYPNRIKYSLFAASFLAMLFAVKTYVNYVSIEEAIEHAIIEKDIKNTELDFTRNFILPYEQSQYASYFLQHENNMLLANEFIIKFEELQQKQEVKTGSVNAYTSFEAIEVMTNQESWKKFILEKISK